MSSAGKVHLYQVSGLWCSSCARALQHALGRLKGVEEASVDFVTHTLKIVSGKDVSLRRVRSAVEEMGYRIEPYRDLGSLRDELLARTRGELMRLAWVAFFAVWTMVLALVEYTEVMGALSDGEYRWLALAMGALSVTGVFGGAYKVYFIGLSGLLRRRPSIDSLLVVTSLACFALSFYNLYVGTRQVYFDSAILVVAIVLGIRAALASLGARQLDLLYQSFQGSEPKVRVVENGVESIKSVNTVKPGYQVRIAQGELISVDGKVLEGEGAAQSALLTGEAEPTALSKGSVVVAGEVLLRGEVLVEAQSFFGERQIDVLGKKVLSSFHESPRKGKVDTVLSFAAPALLVLAGVSLWGMLALGIAWELALPRALATILVACPCALFFCRPLPLLSAQFLARSKDLLLLRPAALLQLPSVRVVAFDKTGTLTSRVSRLELKRNESPFCDSDLWQVLAGAESNLHHPIAYGVQEEANRLGLVPAEVEERTLTEIGVFFRHRGRLWFFGRAEGGDPGDLVLKESGSKQSVASFRVVSEGARGAEELMDSLRPHFLTAVLSGDHWEATRDVSEKLCIDVSKAGLRPSDKAESIHRFREKYGKVLYCGDGYNDVEALSESDVGVCMPHAAASVRLAADVQLLRCNADVFQSLFKLGRRVKNRFYQNLFIAISYNAIAIPAAIVGVFAPWVAAAAMGSATLAILVNSMR